jgi:hypothetical protein
VGEDVADLQDPGPQSCVVSGRCSSRVPGGMASTRESAADDSMGSRVGRHWPSRAVDDDLGRGERRGIRHGDPVVVWTGRPPGKGAAAA